MRRPVYRLRRAGKVLFYGHDSGCYPAPTMDTLCDGTKLDIDQLLLSHDFGIAFNLHAVGGNGYTYVHDSFLPRLRERGVDEATIERITVANPRRILAIPAAA